MRPCFYWIFAEEGLLIESEGKFGDILPRGGETGAVYRRRAEHGHKSADVPIRFLLLSGRL